MSDPSLFDVVRNQRAYRAFRADPIDDELVERILQAATFAPSAENTQPWVFVVVRDAAYVPASVISPPGRGAATAASMHAGV